MLKKWKYWLHAEGQDLFFAKSKLTESMSAENQLITTALLLTLTLFSRLVRFYKHFSLCERQSQSENDFWKIKQFDNKQIHVPI